MTPSSRPIDPSRGYVCEECGVANSGTIAEGQTTATLTCGVCGHDTHFDPKPKVER